MKRFRLLSAFFIIVCGSVIISAIVSAILAPPKGGISNSPAKPEADAISFSRTWLTERINSSLSEDEAKKLGVAYLLGEKEGLSKDFKESLQVAGLSHVVVASGAHLSIIVGFVRKIFGRISRKTGLTFALIFVVFFMALIGWTPSILRAGIMTILTLVSWYFGRKFQPFRLIIITAAITLLINPNFVTNLGWQLSFASYAGIMLLGPIVTEFFYGEKKPKFFGSMILTTFSATLLVAPISLYHFGSLSLLSVFANILILPTLSIVMGLTFVAGLFAGIPIISPAVSWSAGLLLNLHRMIISFLGEKTYFLVTIPKENPAVFLLYPAIIIPFAIFTIKRQRARPKLCIEKSFIVPDHSLDNVGTWDWTKRNKNAKIS